MTQVDVKDTSDQANAVSAPAVAAAPPEVTTKQPRKKLNLKPTPVSKRSVAEALLVVAVLVLAAFSAMLYNDKKDLNNQLAQISNNPQIAVQKQTDDLLAKVGSLMQLPKGETPTIAGVSDAAKAKKQSAFFADAQNGDKVLMYVKAGQAILYRPSTERIILVAPLTFSSPATDTTSTSAAPATITKTRQ